MLATLSYKTLSISIKDIAEPICPLPPPNKDLTTKPLKYLDLLSNFIFFFYTHLFFLAKLFNNDTILLIQI